MAEHSGGQLAVCADFGSTFTKVLLVDLVTGAVVAGAEHRTTIDTDVLDGYDVCLAELARADPRAADAEVLACSSAGGGLRVAVVGNEELVTAEAGRRVALSSGGKVVTVRAVAQGHDLDLTADAPDVVLLTGGTDGGNHEPILRAARGLKDSGWRGPTVVAGNVDARDEVSAILGERSSRARRQRGPADRGAGPGVGEVRDPRGVPLPRHRRQAPEQAPRLHGRWSGARRRTSSSPASSCWRGRSARSWSSTSAAPPPTCTRSSRSTRSRRSSPGTSWRPTPVTRTVEGDLGMRWSAVSTVDEAGLADLEEAARTRRENPGFLPTTDRERDEDEAIARAAVALALRRHAGRSKVVVSPEGRVVERSGVDLREVDLVVGSGGVLRHGREGVADRVLGPSIGRDGDWQLPERARVVVDSDYVLAAAGLLAADHPDAAYRLVTSLLDESWID